MSDDMMNNMQDDSMNKATNMPTTDAPSDDMGGSNDNMDDNNMDDANETAPAEEEGEASPEDMADGENMNEEAPAENSEM